MTSNAHVRKWTKSARMCNNTGFVSLQASLQELVIDESDPLPARLVLYSNLPITCQEVRNGNPSTCWIDFAIKSSEDIAMRQRLESGVYPGSSKKHVCTYRMSDTDWKQDEGLAYNNKTSLDIVAKVNVFANHK